VTDVAGLSSALEELRVAEEELRAQNEELAASRLAAELEKRRYAELFDLAPVAYLLTDGFGKILEANEVAAQLLDLDRALLPGKVLPSFVPGRERREFRRLLLSLPSAEEIVESEIRLISRRGQDRIVAAHVRARPSSENAYELRWSLRDVTAERQAAVEFRLLNEELEARVAQRAEELSRERARLEAVVEQSPVGLVVVSETAEAELANVEAMRILGLSPGGLERFSNPSQWTTFRPDGTPYDLEALPLSRSLGTGEVVHGERLEVVRPDGLRVLVEVDSSPIRDLEGRIVGAVAVVDDVTERERLERAEREFVTNAAHELRTPLAAISGAIEVLQAGAKEVPEERDRFLEHIDRECGRLARLTTSLLSLARAQGGVEEPRLDLVELCPLLETLASRARTADGVVVEADCPPDLAAVSNAGLLEQALANLVSNAAHHTSEGSIVLTADSDGDRKVAIEVRDTGRGMTPEERARVTERFYRGSDGEGFGLGLAIAAESARALGAELELESEVGRGTVARIVLSSARLVTTT
jgi:PAS domain S-box-containing protein